MKDIFAVESEPKDVHSLYRVDTRFTDEIARFFETLSEVEYPRFVEAAEVVYDPRIECCIPMFGYSAQDHVLYLGRIVARAFRMGGDQNSVLSAVEQAHSMNTFYDIWHRDPSSTPEIWYDYEVETGRWVVMNRSRKRSVVRNYPADQTRDFFLSVADFAEGKETRIPSLAERFKKSQLRCSTNFMSAS